MKNSNTRIILEKELLNRIPSGFILVLPIYEQPEEVSDFRISFINKSALEYFGSTSDNAGYLSSFFNINDELITAVNSIAPDSQNIELIIKQKDRGKLLKLTLFPLNGMAALSFNIPDMQEVEYDFTDELFVRTFHASPDAYIISRMEDGKIIEVNRATEDLFLYSKEEMTGKTSLELGLFLDKSDRVRAVDIIKSSGSIRDFATTIVQKPGTTRKISLSAEIINLKSNICMVTSIKDITDRERMESALRTSEQRFKSTLDNMIEGCAILDFEWNYLYVNPANAAHAHLTPAEMIGKNLIELIPGVQQSPFFKIYESVMKNRIPQQVESDFIFADGSKAWYQAIAQPVPEGIFVISMDITERKQVEKALIENQKLLQSTMDNFPTVIAFKDTEGRFLNVNKVVENVLGKPKEEIIGLTDYDIVQKELADEFRKNDLEVMITREPRIREEITRLSENVLYQLDISFPLIDSEGLVYGVGHIAHDITEIKKVEEQLKKNEAILMLILDHINEGIIVSDSPDGKITAVSRWGINHTLGQSVDSVLNLPINKYLEQWDVRYIGSKERAAPETLPLARALKGEVIQGEEWKMVRPDGSSFITSVNAVPIYDPQTNQVMHAVATWSDITERKKTEEFLKTAKESLQEQLNEKEILLKELYHRTKNNMQVISSLLRLKSSVLQNSETEEIFADMQSRIRSISLVHEKLYQSQNLSRVNLKEYVYDLVHLLYRSHSVNDQKIEFIYELDDVTVLLDHAVPTGLIITELIINAIKYAFPEQRAGFIKISLKRLEDSSIELRVSDNGVGFVEVPAEQYTEEAGKIGINLVKIIAVDQLGGEVTMENKNGVTWIISFNDNYYFERV